MNNILVIGDIMLDSYIYVDIHKIANESPIPVFSYKFTKNILGGCGNVYENMKMFNNTIYLLSVIGNDNTGEIIENLTDKYQNIFLFKDNERTTTIKTRIISENKILFRYDNENTFNISKEIEEKIIIKLNEILDKIDIVVFSDYNKGFLTENICQYIIQQCNKLNKITIGDLKYNFNYYKNITISKPNIQEAKKYSKLEKIETIHKFIFENIKCKYSIITLGKDGISLFDGNNFFRTIYESSEVIDVTGAGDIVTAVLGSLYYHNDLHTVLKISTYLATLSVKKIGTYEINHKDILSAYKWLKNKNFTNEIIFHLKNSQLKIVFTNGCFDILHTGHLYYLEKAKELGDILIIGLNTDESIKKLKGNKRPINNLKDRMFFLSKFDFIDFIIPFSEDTPLNLIKQIEPDFLVKGGDYKINEIIGKEFAKETIILPFIEDKSTTNILSKLSL
jgi:D-beta-D-heptose 7-phosphate kinase/D-beta-D-heptose 1-phosphate adenosyltransferase